MSQRINMESFGMRNSSSILGIGFILNGQAENQLFHICPSYTLHVPIMCKQEHHKDTHRIAGFHRDYLQTA